MALGGNIMCLAPANDLVGALIIGPSLLPLVIPPVERQRREVKKLVEVFLIGGIVLGRSAPVQFENVAAEQKLVSPLFYPHFQAARKRLAIGPG